ncbi:hypothetical protein [Methyloceanibacter sp.]
MSASDELTRIIFPSLAEVGRAMIKDLSDLASSPVPRIEKDGTRIVIDVF